MVPCRPGHVVIHDRSLFMQQAYTAMLTGTVLEMPWHVRQQVATEVTQDLLGVIRSLSPPGFEYAGEVEKLREQLLSATRPN